MQGVMQACSSWGTSMVLWAKRCARSSATRLTTAFRRFSLSIFIKSATCSNSSMVLQVCQPNVH